MSGAILSQKIYLIQMTTIIYKLVTTVTTGSVYDSDVTVAQTKLFDMSHSVLPTRVSNYKS